MAFLGLARRFSSTPMSCLLYSKNHFLNPKITSSVFTIFDRYYYNSMTHQHSSSFEKPSSKSSVNPPSTNSVKSLSSLLLLNPSSTYFLSGARYENPSNLNQRRIWCSKFTSEHKEVLDILPKELYNVTLEEFLRATKILSSSMELLKELYVVKIAVPLIVWHFMGDAATTPVILYTGVLIRRAVQEYVSVTRVDLLGLLQELAGNKLQTQNLVFQLLKELSDSDSRYGREKFYRRVFLLGVMIICVFNLQDDSTSLSESE